MRSINTSVIALLPIGAILFAGVVLLGAGPLKDLSLALFIGVAVGAYSSIFIAPALCAGFKEREPAMQALAKQVAARQGKAAGQWLAERVAQDRSSPGGRRGRRRDAGRGDRGTGRGDQRGDSGPAA